MIVHIESPIKRKLFKVDDNCGDFHSAAKTTEIWIVSSGKLFLSPFSPFSLFWLPPASGNADTQQALENWPKDKMVSKTVSLF